MATLIPAFSTFEAAYDAGLNQVVYAKVAADLDTPVSIMLKLAGARTDSFILESVTGGEVRGRYSIIGLKPDLIWKCDGTTAALNRNARFDPDSYTTSDLDPLASLRALIAESKIDMPAELPASAAGLFGYLGYDMIRLVEHLPNVNPDPIGLPDAVLMRPSVIAILDGVKGDVILDRCSHFIGGLIGPGRILDHHGFRVDRIIGGLAFERADGDGVGLVQKRHRKVFTREINHRRIVPFAQFQSPRCFAQNGTARSNHIGPRGCADLDMIWHVSYPSVDFRRPYQASCDRYMSDGCNRMSQPVAGRL